VPHIVVRRLETGAEELIFATVFGIVSGSTYYVPIFIFIADDLFYWDFFHSDASMIDFLLHKSSFKHIQKQAPAPDSCGIHSATVLLVDARALNAHKHLAGLTIGAYNTVLDSVGHGSHHDAVRGKIQLL
jgi:hypothetical protein